MVKYKDETAVNNFKFDKLYNQIIISNNLLSKLDNYQTYKMIFKKNQVIVFYWLFIILRVNHEIDQINFVIYELEKINRSELMRFIIFFFFIKLMYLKLKII